MKPDPQRHDFEHGGNSAKLSCPNTIFRRDWSPGSAALFGEVFRAEIPDCIYSKKARWVTDPRNSPDRDDC